ncbi:hypothetical protein [Aquimarina addita]|uniref:hypothetical protein n=1 Tax=Aquimarina addita TaxID=870485 RepID=UPI0031E6B55B
MYLTITALLIIKVGQRCYQHGNTFVMHLVPGDKDFCLRINNILLIGYYLINIGYAVITLSGWSTINSIEQMIESISNRTATIICILAVLHYFNLFWITKFIKNIK